LNKQLDVDKFEELKDRIEDQMADVQERQEFFINAGGQEDNDELLDELDELEAELEAEKFNEVEIGSGAIREDLRPVPAQPRAAAK
jgi:uncharacterized membrane-anchored protein